MSFREFVSRILHHWALIALIIVGVVGAVWIYSAAQTAQYSARSTVLVSARAGTTVQELQQSNNFMQGRVTTYTTLVTTPLVLERVIAELGLETTPAELARNIEAISPQLTSLIEIAVTYPDPDLAAEIANSAAESLVVAVDEIEAPIVPGDAPVVDAAATSPVRVDVIEAASVPEEPSSPNWRLNTILAVAVGGVLAVTVVALLSTLGTRIRGARDVRQVTNAPILGRIAHGPRTQPLPVVGAPGSARAESYRVLRTNVQSLVDGSSVSIAVTSSAKLEMRTGTTLNLAIALTQAGAKVVVVDADLREPMVAHLLDLPSSVGLADVLAEDVAFENAVQRWKDTELSVVPAGRSVSNPSELLNSTRMTAFIEQLEREFDFVLVDTPAVLQVTDAAVVAKRVGATLVVCTAGRTRRSELAETVETLEQANARVTGIVLMLPRRPSRVDNDATHFESILGDDNVAS